MTTQQVMTGTDIPVHRHFKMDEAFYVLDGSGTFILDGVRHSFEEGGTIFIPRNSWHDLRILMTNFSSSGSFRLPASTAFSATHAARQESPQSISP
jgi:hypothetical protein